MKTVAFLLSWLLVGFSSMAMAKTSITHGKLLAAASTHKTINRSSRVFVFDPRRHMWYAYQNGRLVKSGRASGGAGWCRDLGRSCRTPSGVFRIQSKGGPGCRSSRYPKPRGGAWMGYCMFFSKYYAIHASNSVPKRNASHGCVRVKPAAARWLSRHFIRIGTKVIVKSY